MTDNDPEVAAVVEELQCAGFVTIGTDADGDEIWTLKLAGRPPLDLLTPAGEAVALALAMSGEEAAHALYRVRERAQARRQVLR